ncbi:MAG: hypothetical protein ACJAXU_000450, partial [Paracoccaceae bacterium]
WLWKKKTQKKMQKKVTQKTQLTARNIIALNSPISLRMFQ